MSFRIYPKYIQGNPRLRVFLPNFWMKLIKPKDPGPANLVHFMVPLEMSDLDVRNYLKKIYQLPVTEVRTQVYSGAVKKNFKNYLIKEDDYRVAFVTLDQKVNFEFPDLFPKAKIDKELEETKKLSSQSDDLIKQKKGSWNRADVPSWFSI